MKMENKTGVYSKLTPNMINNQENKFQQIFKMKKCHNLFIDISITA
jgi:hypothetical protein